jgi:hypothetical protein
VASRLVQGARGKATLAALPTAQIACMLAVMSDQDAPRLSAGGIDALRYAGQRQLTRWGARRLSLRNEQRRAELTVALAALRTLKHHGCDCELRRVPPGP